MANPTAFPNLIIAETTPMKQSKKKLKYKKTLNALKLFIASIFVFRFKNINSDAILLIRNFIINAVNTGIILRNRSNHILDGKNKRIERMARPTTTIEM